MKKREEAYLTAATDWDTDRETNRIQTAKRDRQYAAAFAALAVLALLAVAMLAPLKTVVPYVIRVDQSTGLVDIINVLKDGKTDYDEAVNKAHLARYVRLREGYLYQTWEDDYDTVGLMSAQRVASSYAEKMDPARSPDAPLKLYGKTARADIAIKSVAFPDKKIASVRYKKTVKRGGQDVVSHWVATIEFTYIAGAMKEQERLQNPLGFQVVEYRTDPETVESGK